MTKSIKAQDSRLHFNRDAVPHMRPCATVFRHSATVFPETAGKTRPNYYGDPRVFPRVFSQVFFLHSSTRLVKKSCHLKTFPSRKWVNGT
jgi:hypothetical protein